MTSTSGQDAESRRETEHATPRRRLLAACVLAAIPATLAPALLGEGATAANAEAVQRPNVVVIYTDDQDIGSMRVMPRVRRVIGRHGVTFRRHVTTLAHCCPSRATFLTGQYTHNHEVVSNRPPDGGWQQFRERENETLAVALQQAGYRTGLVGRYLNGYPWEGDEGDIAAPGPIPPGWSEWFALINWRMLGWQANDNGQMRRLRGPRQYQTDVLKQRSMRFIRRSAMTNEPFFLKVSTLAPHLERPGVNWRENPRSARRHQGLFSRLPLRVGPAFDRVTRDKPFFVRKRQPLTERQQRRLSVLNRNRLRTLQAVDDLVRDVVGQLRRSGELDNTYVIFTSDNGFMLGEHRQIGKNRLYEPSIRVPFLIRGPGLPARARRPQLTANIDLAPTIYDITGAEPLLEPDGISMLPAARRPDVDADRHILITSTPGKVRGPSIGLRTPRWMYAEHETPNGETEYELYDMRRDRHQLRNLARASDPERPQSRPELVHKRQRLKARLDELRDCAGTAPPHSCR